MNTSTRKQSGQVLLAGIVIIVVLLVAVLVLFDVHNIIRAKFKTETACQSAALAAAEWQRKSLNLIGELNMIKACEALLEQSSAWKESGYFPDLAGDAKRMAIQDSRSKLLTEMQTRVSFFGPLTGFAAAQQAAKANGLPVTYDLRRSLQRYTELQESEYDTVNNYKWSEPYYRTLQNIMDNGIAVLPNCYQWLSIAVTPPQLGYQSLYREIYRHEEEIMRGDPPPEQSSWLGVIYPFVRNWREQNFEGQWWGRDTSVARSPFAGGEIYFLDVAFAESNHAQNYETLKTLLQPQYTPYAKERINPAIKFATYTRKWNIEPDRDLSWYDGKILRKPVKPQYRYEGPVAYAEGAVKVGSLGRYSANGKNTLRKRDRQITHVGSERHERSDDDYRPGAVAKALGELPGNRPPNTVSVVLPVFKDITLLPTYMPQNLNVMPLYDDTLMAFLFWLCRQKSLWVYEQSPPDGGSYYLKALQTLCDGPGFRYYGYNPKFNAADFDRNWRDHAAELFDNDSIKYSQGNPSGAGWLQEPQLFTLPGGEVEKDAVIPVEDYLNGGTAHRVFKSGSNQYIVIDSKGHIVTNDEADPTSVYSTGGDGGGDGWGGGSYKPDSDLGPPRI